MDKLFEILIPVVIVLVGVAVNSYNKGKSSPPEEEEEENNFDWNIPKKTSLSPTIKLEQKRGINEYIKPYRLNNIEEDAIYSTTPVIITQEKFSPPLENNVPTVKKDSPVNIKPSSRSYVEKFQHSCRDAVVFHEILSKPKAFEQNKF
jgi:hypothetical protein